MAGRPVIWSLAIAGAIVAAPFLKEAAKPRMDTAARGEAPGHFTDLAMGKTHYMWRGPVDGPVAVCVHGLTTPSKVWDAIAADLVVRGYRVLVYDLFGRGYSDRPGGRQDSAFFLRQLSDLLADQGVEKDITLLGYSMGGAIAATFAARHPGRIRQMILFAPVGMGHELGQAGQLAKWPGLGDWLIRVLFARSQRKGVAAERHLPAHVPGMAAYQLSQPRYAGYVPAVLNSLRGIIVESRQAEQQALARSGIPTLAIWGQDDRTIPIAAKAVAEGWNPAMQHHVVPGAGHGLVYTHTPELLQAMAGFLR